MATKTLKPKNTRYGAVQRGTSLTIPVLIKQVNDEPLDLTGMNVSFTVKKIKNDFDRDDARAYIQKDFEPQEPIQGRFFIMLTSKDTDFETGDFYFDIEITNLTTGMVYRICTLEFELVGGPTNRTVNTGIGQLPLGNEITVVQLEQGAPIIIVAPMLAFAPELYSRFVDLAGVVEHQTSQIDDLYDQLEIVKRRIEDLI